MIEEQQDQVMSMPQSRANEEALLGALLIDSEMLRRISLEPDDFYIVANGWIFAAMQELAHQGQSVDYITVCTYLDGQKRLAEIGGPVKIMGLINAMGSSMGVESYANVIKERAKRRRIIYATQKLVSSAFDLDSDLSGAVSEALDVLAKSVVSTKGAVHISQYVSAIYDEVEEAVKNPKEIYGIPTGFIDWDNISYGLQKGEKVLLSGEPGVGKSVLAAQILINAARNGHPGALYEFEMSGRQVVRRALAAHTKNPTGKKPTASNITTQKMRQGKLTDDEVTQFTKAVEAMSNLPIYISDTSEMTTVEMRADLMRLKDYFGIEEVVIDYEGLLMDAPDKDDNQRSKLISKRVHDIAKDLDLAVISISDMTKEGIKQQVKGQGAVAGTARSLHDADQIIVIRKDDKPNVVRLTWEKMREGDGDRFLDLVRIPGFPMFGDATRGN